MHFWIDKRSLGGGFSGRYMVPPSLAGCGRNQRYLCGGGFHPKPMVTPVHRFQSIESVANHRPAIRSPPQHHGVSGASRQDNPPVDMITTTASRRLSTNPTAKLKCGVWVFFATVTFFLAGAKYYFHGVNIGMEAFAFCSLLIIILIIGGMVSLYEAIIAQAPPSEMTVVAAAPPMEAVVVPLVELPPPPYHIAIALPPQAHQVIRDSPPPSYEKAVT